MGKNTDVTIAATAAALLIVGPIAEGSEKCDVSEAIACGRATDLPNHGNEEGAPVRPAWAAWIPVRGTDTRTDSRPPDDVSQAFWDQDAEYAEAHAADVDLIISTGTQVGNSGWD